MLTYLALSKAGYGSLAELRDLDTPDLLDIVEFEMMTSDIESYKMEQASNGHR